MADSLPWLVAFDLDDTLIAEKEYQVSGILAVEKYLGSLYSASIDGTLLAAHNNGVSDLWAYACDFLQLPSSVATTLLWIYRLHFPNLKLQSGLSHVLCSLELMDIPVVILSDGRSVTQRLKLKAVGLENLPCYLSEEWNSTKPETLRFEAIAARWPNRRYIYIGDNPAKDFQAPNKLGWLTLGSAWTPHPVHPQNFLSSTQEDYPNAWLHSPSDLLAWLL